MEYHGRLSLPLLCMNNILKRETCKPIIHVRKIVSLTPLFQEHGSGQLMTQLNVFVCNIFDLATVVDKDRTMTNTLFLCMFIVRFQSTAITLENCYEAILLICQCTCACVVDFRTFLQIKGRRPLKMSISILYRLHCTGLYYN